MTMLQALAPPRHPPQERELQLLQVGGLLYTKRTFK